jgi:hypothetical protein
MKNKLTPILSIAGVGLSVAAYATCYYEYTGALCVNQDNPVGYNSLGFLVYAYSNWYGDYVQTTPGGDTNKGTQTVTPPCTGAGYYYDNSHTYHFVGNFSSAYNQLQTKIDPSFPCSGT